MSFGRFDRQTVQRLVALAKPFFVSAETKWRAWGLFVLLVSFLLCIKGMDVLLSYVGRDFMTALSLRQRDAFYTELWHYLLAFAIATPIIVFYRYTEERFALFWRKWLSLRVLSAYLDRHAYYQIGQYSKIDNPDQRIEEDVRSFTSMSLSLLLIVLQSIVAFTFFIGVLWSISASLTLVAVGYAVIGSIFTYFIGRPLIALNFEQLRKDADYRYKLINVRDNAESIAFYEGEQREYRRVRQRLKIVLSNMRGIIERNRKLNFFTTSYNYVLGILPTVIVAPLCLDGEIEFGVVIQAGIAFNHVLNALSIIVQNFGSLSAYAAVITRLGSFTEAIDEVKSGEDERGIAVREGTRIELEDVEVDTPRGDQTLIRDLSLEHHAGGLLINGPSGSGKSSLLRVVAGLWRSGRGRVVRPPLERCMFLPQRPYMTLGSLRDQLHFGSKRRGIPDRELVHALDLAGLSEMRERIGGLDAVVNWTTILSTGEQQRLAFARLFLKNPEYVFLDEATTAVDPEGEAELYELLAQRVTCYVSVGPRANLAQYHARILSLRGGGTYRIEEVTRGA